MALRAPLQQCLRAANNLSTTSLCRTFSSSATTFTQQPKQTTKKRRRDPYALEQARARKAANISRQKVLKEDRAAQLGDPIRGNETEFVRSFDNPPTTDSNADSNGRLNFFVRSSELEDNIAKSKWLMTPKEQPTDQDSIENITSSDTPEQRRERREAEHENAAEALRRINKLELGSSKDRLRVNVQRCINVLGRHNTDGELHSRPGSTETSKTTALPRIGPDTGSSEVQIGILTAKIRTLTQFLEGRGKMDKHNRRNLTILVHRRQKLMRYLQRKEKGGPRWQNLIQTLGLTDGAWKGEIVLPRYI
ncbi:hypothetical protein AMS68_003382 [Peltaster fructicola]|uniref:Ribosomal protein S15 n=1 Tax=Peltaster fructicola TaxID=286661 RepID=A0A6H0XT94_9PEZI|nr:hypothetical protein AMS68_003382 [Peltaster fructicola]